jgi:predicted HAD superfamily Cof-like phosphohydrolase
MNKMQEQVRAFHEKFGATIGAAPGIPEEEESTLRLSLIFEEFLELVLAVGRRDTPQMIDAICDLLFVVWGTAEAFGVKDIEPFFDEVFRSNMTKEGGGTRADGKILKGPNYEPPRIKELLEKLFSWRVERNQTSKGELQNVER